MTTSQADDGVDLDEHLMADGTYVWVTSHQRRRPSVATLWKASGEIRTWPVLGDEAIRWFTTCAT